MVVRRPLMPPIVSVTNLAKTYASGFQALKAINLDIRRGEIFALLGPNGAGKTTLISIICGIVTPSQGTVAVGGHDIVTDYRVTRSMIGLVPQELHTDAFETVWATASFSRGLFGLPRNPEYIEKVLKDPRPSVPAHREPAHPSGPRPASTSNPPARHRSPSLAPSRSDPPGPSP
jgi:ABC-2 type transport system ATP-binding protein